MFHFILGQSDVNLPFICQLYYKMNQDNQQQKQQQQQYTPSINHFLMLHGALNNSGPIRRHHHARNVTAGQSKCEQRMEQTRPSNIGGKTFSVNSSQKNLKGMAHYFQGNGSMQHTPSRTTALTSRASSKLKVLSPKNGAAAAYNSAKKKPAQFTQRHSSSNKKAILSSKKKAKVGEHVVRSKPTASAFTTILQPTDLTHQNKKPTVQILFPRSARPENIQTNHQKSTQQVKQNLFNQEDFSRVLDNYNQPLSNMEYTPTISILGDHKISQQSNQNHNGSTAVMSSRRHDSKQDMKVNTESKQDENLQSSSGKDNNHIEMSVRPSQCLFTASPASKATEAHQNYMDAPFSNRGQSEYGGDPYESCSLQTSQLKINEQQSSTMFKLPMQRKSRKDRKKQRQDSTTENQKRLGVKDRFNKRITCMSPDEHYSTPRIDLSSTNIKVMMSDKQTLDDPMYMSSMQEDNKKLVDEGMSDYPEYTCRKVESALKTQVETQAQTSENLAEKASVKGNETLILSPKDDMADYSLAMIQSKKQLQRFSIMSPRVVPTAHIDLANKQRQVYTRLGNKPLKLKKKLSKNCKTSSNQSINKITEVQKKMKQMFDNKQILSKLKQVQKDFDAKNKPSSPLLATIRTIDQNTKPKGSLKTTQTFGFDQAFMTIEQSKSKQKALLNTQGRHKSPPVHRSSKGKLTHKMKGSTNSKGQITMTRGAQNANASIVTQTFQTTTCSMAENSQRNTRTDRDSNADKFKQTIVNTVTMDSTVQETSGQDTNVYSSSNNPSLNLFKKNVLGLTVRTAECTYKSRYSKLGRTNNGLSANRQEQSNEFEIKFTNKARPRCLPVKSSIFQSNKQLAPSSDQKFPSVQIEKTDSSQLHIGSDPNQPSFDPSQAYEKEKITIQLNRLDGRSAGSNVYQRPRSVKESLEKRHGKKDNLLDERQLMQQYRDNSVQRVERIREKSVPKLTISFNNRKVSVETSRGRSQCETSQKKFLQNIENEIKRYTIKKSRQNSNSSICFSNEIRIASTEKGLFGIRPYSLPKQSKETKSQRNRSPDQLSVRSKGSTLSKKFDPRNLLRLFGGNSSTQKGGGNTTFGLQKSSGAQASQQSTSQLIHGGGDEEHCVDMSMIKPLNTKDKVGDPVDNVVTSTLPFKDISMSKERPIYLESEDKWFENMKLLRFYSKYDRESLPRFEYNNPYTNVGQLIKTEADAKLMGQLHKGPLEFTNLTFLPQMKEKVIGEGSLLRFKPQYRAKNDRKCFVKAASSLKRGTFEKVYCQLTQQHLNIFLNCRDKLDSLKHLRQNYYKNFVKRKNLNYRELIEKYSRYPKQTKNIDEFLEFLAEPSPSDVKIRSIPIQDIVDMKQLNSEQLEAIGMKNSTDNIVRLVLKGEESLKAASPESEGIDKSYMQDSMMNNMESKCNDLLGLSGEQYAQEIKGFDEDDQERSTLLDIMINEEEPGTKVFEEEFCMFEEFIQKQDDSEQREDEEVQAEGDVQEPQTPDGLGMKYLLKIDELQSEQSDQETTQRKKKGQETPEFIQEKRSHKRKNSNQFAQLSFPKIKKQGLVEKPSKTSRNHPSNRIASKNSTNQSRLTIKVDDIKRGRDSLSAISKSVHNSKSRGRVQSIQSPQPRVAQKLRNQRKMPLTVIRGEDSLQVTPNVAIELTNTTNTREKDHENFVKQRHTYEQIHNKVLEVVFDQKPKPFSKNKKVQEWVEASLEPINITEKNKEQELIKEAQKLSQKRAISVQIKNNMQHRGRVVTTDDEDKMPKSRLQQEIIMQIEKSKLKRKRENSREIAFYKELFSGLIFKL